MEAEMSEITGQPLDDVVMVPVPSKKTKITLSSVPRNPIISTRRTRSSVDHDGEKVDDDGVGGDGEQETYAFVLHDDGQLTKVPIDNISGDGSDAPEGIFCVSLPKDKVKDRNNPLPGSNTLQFGSNKRKSKQTPLNYGENDYPQFLVSSSDSSGCSTNEDLNQHEHDQIDDVVLDNLDANDMMKTLESVLLEKIAEEGNHTLDQESFNMPTSIPIQNSSPSINLSSPPSTTETTVAKTLSVTPISQSNVPRSPSSSSSRKISECDQASLNIRRSQRQQERIDKQEADRIREENQQMLQREKELMKEGKSPMPSPAPNIVPAGSPAPAPSLTPTTPTPTSTNKVVVKSPTTTPTPSTPVNQQQKLGRENVSTSANTKSNKRERKVPAIYADPNFILDDDTKIVLEVADPSKVKPEEKVMVESEDVQPESVASEPEPEHDDGIDDPNRLWCICRQPHNNRFMICCDKCEDWFHGKCVGVTKAQGKAIEVAKEVWHCPPCKKILRQEKILEQQKQREALALSKHKKSATEKNETKDKNRKSSTSAQQQQQQKNVQKSPTTKLERGQILSKQQKLTIQHQKQKLIEKKRMLLNNRLSSENIEKPKVENSESCMVCTKAARPDSVYCSDECINIYSESTRSKSSALLDQSSSPKNKVLKRTNSKGELLKSEGNFLTFHVISAGEKSTEVVPQKVKELKKQVGSPVTPNSKQASPPSTTLNKSSTTTPEIKKRLSTTADENSKKQKDSTSSSSRKRNDSSADHDKKETRDSKKRERTRKDSESKKEPIKTESGRGVDNESLMKENIRKALKAILKERTDKTLTASEIKKLENSPESLSKKIEEELTKYYGSVSNTKCKAKYRSIYFNLKEEKNNLWREILEGKIKPRTLVKMEPHEMASAELVQWRQSQNQKEIEMIKKSEIDKLAEAKKQALIDSGAEIDKVIVAETETRAMNIADVIKGHDEKSVSSKSSTDKDKKSDSKKSSDKDKKSSSRDRDRKDNHSSSSSRRDSSSRRSERHSSRHDKKDEKSSSSHSSKDKDESKKSRHERHEKKISFEKDDSQIKRQNSDESPHTNSNSASDESISQDSQNFNLKSSVVDIIPSSKIIERHSIDSEQEQPSSTIKTPDYADDPLKREGALQPRFKTKIMMHDLGSFNACAFDCSHNPNELEQPLFPDTPVPVVGRINPDTVWDYIDKMKKNKEVIVFRLEPAAIADKEGYMTFFTYLSSRGRLGVLGSVFSPIKDVYLLPLGEHTPVNRALLPFHGPGLPVIRTHCLLAIVTRHTNELLIPPSIPASVSKRKSTSGSSPIDITHKKKARFDIKPGAIAALSNEKRHSLSSRTADDDDDDKPYEPWEEEDEKVDDGVEIVSIDDDKIATPVDTFNISISELEAKIQKEKEVIASMASAIPSASSASSQIPGLDGIFSGVGSSSKKEEQIPFFSRMPPPEATPPKGTISKKEDSISPSILKTPDKIVNLNSSSESESSKVVLPTTTTTTKDCDEMDADGDLDEAYSPGDLPDDDIEEIEAEKSSLPEEKNEKKVVDMEIDDEPLPPGEEKSEGVLEKPKFQPIPLLTLPHTVDLEAGDNSTLFVDLTEDSEPIQVIPPPPQRFLRPPQRNIQQQQSSSLPQENNLLDAFPDKNVVVAPTQSKAPSKMKININLNMGSSKGSGPSSSS